MENKSGGTRAGAESGTEARGLAQAGDRSAFD